ncbi:LysR family transcriptional regulator [Allokutzneria sp. A3M-2-11 16]|uniref:LysR family transcriptional regulator n=1 Tax=Allokutzneria sp. A3M-2-11 16 TaxID=2962043 RepID=UPI002113C88F|nr:LysR substrate-binding domain-containing protein [Allokutzneria sp. A3M-2-11 16]
MPISDRISLLFVDLVRHLRYFLAVAEELHFGRAARRLHMSQPPLSQRIQRLEHELGVRLFDRAARQVRLTDAGAALLVEAREVLGRVDHLHTVADRLRRGEAGVLRGGMLPDLPGDVVASLVSEFRDRCPDVRLTLRELTTAEQLRALADRTLDVGVLRHPFDAPWLDQGEVLSQPLGVLCPPGWPPGPLRLADLAGQELVIFPRTTAPALHDELLSTCARHGFTPRVVHEAATPGFALGLVLAGGAVALHHLDSPAPHPDVRCLPLVGAPLAWRTSPVWPRGKHTPAVAAFAEILTARLTPAELAPRPPLHPRPTTEYLP